ncbi:hypothetical protein Amet_4178 [Alkaliphilus metalliredigens QYMF]|uniref:Molybdopterin cofactor biosynthesis MoaD-related C-terminal domain-containing protein n=1 Tax=Alkaliphilus metalliredigens (strain QYMF) TaxID=293826 RepID=A6TVP1_ALKMQ|nr:hypothetical protein [Alkaliphilus metalliredigens]ABR50259.1 hypothetical protein Amet_4178 [Alkaliphilus metalliredigens QYMF]
MKIQRVHETRGVTRAELAEYFKELASCEAGGAYYGKGWQVILAEEKICRLGSIKLPEVTITFHGEEGVYHEMIAIFRLKFLRAGG